MKVYHSFGVESLNTMMYGIRAAHAILSLMAVWAAYRTTELTTRSWKWAVGAGLLMAAHFALPFLSVRNLIEMVSGNIWIVAIYFLYRYREERSLHWLIAAGSVTGLAWMIRFQLAFAFLAVPFVLLYQERRVKPALYYCVTVLLMVALSGLVDYWLLGDFLASSFNHVKQGITEGVVYNTSILIYPAVILSFFIPPLSLLLFFIAGQKRFWSNHLVLSMSTLSFVLIHMLIPSRQERYMIPIIPALVLLVVLAMWQHRVSDGFLFRWKKLLYGLAGFSLVINVLLVGPFTFNYSHKGLVEPLIRLEGTSPKPTVLFVSPEESRIYPLDYSGFELINRYYLNDWHDLPSLATNSRGRDSIDYFFFYPNKREYLARYVDSVSQYFGPLKELFHVAPSTVDRILYCMNTQHNRSHEVWVYAPSQSRPYSLKSSQVR